MRKCNLGDVSDVITGPFGSQLHASDYVEFGVPSIMPQDIGDRKVITDKIAYITEGDAERLKKYRVDLGDIVYSRRGDIERCALVRNENVGSLCGTGCLRVRPDKKQVDSEFLSFYLSTPHIKKWVVSNATGATMLNLNSDILKRLPLQLPKLDIQKKIAMALNTIDKKINNNHQMIIELEQLAKTIYDYYFLQFDFPDANGRPYRASDGKMVYNKELGREIPVGWVVEHVKNIADVQYGYPFDTEMFSITEGMPVVRIRDILSLGFSARTLECVSDKYLLNNRDLIIGMDGNFHMNFWDGKIAYLNQRSVRIRGNDKVSTLLIKYAIHPYIKAREKNVNRTTVGHLGADDINSLLVCLPHDESERKKICKKFDDILSIICHKKRENDEMIKLRDFLLPLLMNGQVTFKETPAQE